MIITAKTIKELCRRASGRTEEIKVELCEFLTGYDCRKVVIVVCKSRTVVSNYVQFFENVPKGILRSITQNSITSNTNNKIILITEDEFTNSCCRFRGLRIENIYFDTPESSLFGNGDLFEYMCRMM